MNPGSTIRTIRTAPESRADASTSPAASGSLYRVIWRWHFYAGMLISPILLVVAITGALYVFRSEIEDYRYAQLRFVVPEGAPLKAKAQVDVARAARPGETPSRLELSADPSRASIVRFGEGQGKKGTTVYVDPYRGWVIGSLSLADGDDLANFFDIVLKIHRQLFLGTTGRLIVELMVGWTIVLLATGVYLWWPQRLAQTLGVWWPRWRAKPYTVLRDLHSVLGIYLLAPILVIVATGLFYALVWSEAFYQVTHFPPRGAPALSASPAPAKPSGLEKTGMSLLSLDRIEELVRARYPGRNLSIALLPDPKKNGIEVWANNDFSNSYGPYVSAQFELNPRDGKLLSHKTLAEDDRYWWHGWVYPLHVGSILGPTTKILWFLACLVLILLPVTGLWMWLKRRPPGRTGFPRRPEKRLSPGLLAMIAGLAVALPVLGASMVLIVAGEYLVQAIRSRRLKARPL